MYRTTESESYRVVNAAVSRKRKKKKTASNNKPATKRTIKNRSGNFKFAVCIVILVFMSCLIINNDAKITTLSKETATLKSELEKQKDENVRLRYEYEKVYSSSVVEEYAKNVLNMSVADKTQIEYVELANEDKIETIDSSPKTAFLIWSGILNIFNTVVEYLS